MPENFGISEEKWRRYGELTDKFRANALAPEEEDELTRLGDEVEQQNVERIEYVAELARLRGITLKQMVTQLGLKPRRVGARR